MELLRDEPVGLGEPHYAQIIKADRLKPHPIYALGTSATTMKPDPQAISESSKPRVERRGNTVEAWVSVVRSQYNPDIIPVKRNDHVILHLTNIEQTPDATHGFSIPEMNVMVSLDPGETTTVEFDAHTPGSFSFYCTEFCSALHLEMQGWLIVEG
jgi:nitrous-oxide reductase